LVSNTLGFLHTHSALYTQLEPYLAPEPVEASMLDFYIGDNPTFDYALQLTYELVHQLKKEIESDGAQFAVVLVSPLSLVEFSQMDADEREQVYQRLPAMRRAEGIKSPNQILTEQFTRNGIPVLDLLPAFLEQGGTSLFFDQDKHWNTQGNKLAAQTIRDWLIDQSLTPPP
jgi:hypothetical protein